MRARLGVLIALLGAALAAQGGAAPAVQLVEGRRLDEAFQLRFNATVPAQSSAGLYLNWLDENNYLALTLTPAEIKVRQPVRAGHLHAPGR